MLKEEGGVSKVCQAYDQHVSEQDKNHTRELLNGFYNERHRVVGEYKLILTIIALLNRENLIL